MHMNNAKLSIYVVMSINIYTKLCVVNYPENRL